MMNVNEFIRVDNISKISGSKKLWPIYSRNAIYTARVSVRFEVIGGGTLSWNKD